MSGDGEIDELNNVNKTCHRDGWLSLIALLQPQQCWESH